MATLALTRRRTNLWGIVAILAAAATALGVFSYLSYLRRQVPMAGKLVSVVALTGDFEAGTEITTSMLALQDHPSKYLPAGALRLASDAIGKTLTVPVFKGEILTSMRVGAHGGVSASIPEGLRAFSLSLEGVTGLAGPIKAGDRVDVIVTFPSEVLGEATTMTILQRKEVSSVDGGRSASESGRVASRLGISSSSGAKAASVTLLVSPEEASKLAMAQTLGKITLVLAPISGQPVPPPPAIRPQNL